MPQAVLDERAIALIVLLRLCGKILNFLPYRQTICEVQLQFLERCGASAQALFELMHAHGFSSWCAEAESNGSWIAGDHRFRPAKTYTSGMIGFDVLFSRHPTPRLRELISSGVDSKPAP